MSQRRIVVGIAMLWAAAAVVCPQPAPLAAATPAASTLAATTVRGRVEVAGSPNTGRKRHGTIPVTVVWLTPMVGASTSNDSADDSGASMPAPPVQTLRLVQKNKTFDPHILVVPAGSLVEFPNRDPFFHNVFSLFEGKRFDLGLYEAGTTRMVRFDRSGISYIFCNIHPEMSAVVITLTTPLYAISNVDGQLSLPDVPFGRYLLHIWSEGMGPENAQPVTREVTIAENASSLGVIRVPELSGGRMAHKNKYGREYDEPTPNSSVYTNQH
jgi:plastocyanin